MEDKMRIVIPSIGEKGLEDSVAAHFGRCAAFTVAEVDIDKKEIVSVQDFINELVANYLAAETMAASQKIDKRPINIIQSQ